MEKEKEEVRDRERGRAEEWGRNFVIVYLKSLGLRTKG